MQTLVAATLAAQMTLMPPQGQPDVLRLLDDYKSGWNTNDPGALARLFAPDAELNSVAATVEGAPDIEQLYAATFASGAVGTTLTIRLDADRTITSDTRSARGRWRLEAAAGPAPASLCGRFWTVLRKDGPAWKIVSFSEVQLDCEAIAL